VTAMNNASAGEYYCFSLNHDLELQHFKIACIFLKGSLVIMHIIFPSWQCWMKIKIQNHTINFQSKMVENVYQGGLPKLYQYCFMNNNADIYILLILGLEVKKKKGGRGGS
jgi:hypothetical protein